MPQIQATGLSEIKPFHTGFNAVKSATLNGIYVNFQHEDAYAKMFLAATMSNKSGGALYLCIQDTEITNHNTGIVAFVKVEDDATGYIEFPNGLPLSKGLVVSVSTSIGNPAVVVTPKLASNVIVTTTYF